MSARFDIIETPIPALRLLRRKPIADGRGYLERIFCSDELESLLLGKCVAQINRTHTARRASVRGMHYQHPPQAETKFVSCLRGEVFDVALDIRRGSPTFLRWHAEILSADNHRTLVIPEGFAHGFQTLTMDCEMLYLHTAPYSAVAEGGLNATDPRLGIQWPLPIADRSARDASHSLLVDGFDGVAT